MIRQLLAALFLLAVGRPVTMGEAIQLLPPDMPGPIVKGPTGNVAAGDTLVYTISWGPGARATSYNYRLAVTATNGSWMVVADSNGSGKWPTATNTSQNGIGTVPVTANVTFLVVKTWLAAVPWDSASFTASVSSQNAAGTSASVSTTWRVMRKPGSPGPITVDSSLIMTGVLVAPPSASLALNASRTICAFQRFGNGAVTQWTADKPGCDSLYLTYVPAPARTLVLAAQQAHTDSLTKTCVTWTSSTAAVGLTPRAVCSAAVTVKGLALTMRPDNTQFRNVGLLPNAAPVLAHLGNGRILCLRVGLGYATATVGGVQRRVPIACNAVRSVLLAL